MIEVFKTNVQDRHHADKIVQEIHDAFTDCRANFDLEDCDNILRVKCSTGELQSTSLISLISRCGFYAEILSE